MAEIAKHGVKYQARAHAKEPRRNDGDNPVDAFKVPCPTKPE